MRREASIRACAAVLADRSRMADPNPVEHGNLHGCVHEESYWILLARIWTVWIQLKFVDLGDVRR